MECVPLEVEGGHLGVGDLDTLRVGARIEFTTHGQAGPGRCGSDQFNHRLAAPRQFRQQASEVRS